MNQAPKSIKLLARLRKQQADGTTYKIKDPQTHCKLEEIQIAFEEYYKK